VITSSVAAPVSFDKVITPASEAASKGLTSDEAHARLRKDGAYTMPDKSDHPLRDALAKFCAPVPWLLEASIVLEIALRKGHEAAVIASLLIFNAALACLQEGRARATLAGAQVASRAQCLRRARRRLEDGTGSLTCMRRPGKTVAWSCSRCRRASDRWIGRTRSVHAHGRVSEH